MTMTDPIADFLTHIRNANSIKTEWTEMPLSKMRTALAIVLKEEGFLSDFEVKNEPFPGTLRVKLRYDQDGERVIREIRRRSKPGCRVYVGAGHIPKIKNGQGICVLSTTRGVVSSRKAREYGVGGELLATIW
jgi:small subunit ribosomal protein S8